MLGVYWDALEEAGAVAVLQHVLANDSENDPGGAPSAYHLAKATLAYLEGNHQHDVNRTHHATARTNPADLGSYVQTKLYPQLAQLHPLYNESAVKTVADAKKKNAVIKQDPSKALLEKNKGNDSFVGKMYPLSIIHYTNALEFDPTNYTVFSNRAAGTSTSWSSLLLRAPCDTPFHSCLVPPGLS